MTNYGHQLEFGTFITPTNSEPAATVELAKRSEALGFDLVEASEINANPKDPANWQGGVWMMPPTLGGDEAMDAQTRDLGESDRMTLLFRKR